MQRIIHALFLIIYFLPSLTTAGPGDPFNGIDVSFGEWSSAGGAISSSADSAWFNGVDLIEDDGFLQTQATINGETYIRQIVAGSNATGTPDELGFFDESIIRVNLDPDASTRVIDGIALRSQVRDSFSGDGAAADFLLTTAIQSSWATATGNTGDTEIKIENSYVVGKQRDVGGNISGQNFNFGFAYAKAAYGSASSEFLHISQGVALSDSTALEVSGSGDATLFVLQQLSGGYVSGGSISGLDSGAGLPGYSDTVTWTAGETIRVFGIGQQVSLGNSAGGASADVPAGFAHVQVENLSTGQVGFASAGAGQATSDATTVGGLSDWIASSDFSFIDDPFSNAAPSATPAPQIFLNN
ncbi:MAG: hypothetical protein GXP10_09215 [Gammaproteobacteria bacterium]|nr:hypothetical protein [Gammaproteobacteria bacterium]